MLSECCQKRYEYQKCECRTPSILSLNRYSLQEDIFGFLSVIDHFEKDSRSDSWEDSHDDDYVSYRLILPYRNLHLPYPFRIVVRREMLKRRNTREQRNRSKTSNQSRTSRISRYRDLSYRIPMISLSVFVVLLVVNFLLLLSTQFPFLLTIGDHTR